MDIFETCQLLSPEQLWRVFDLPDGTSKHLLILYSLVVGTNAQTILELGLGRTTGALRAAAHATGGVVHTCDFDERRFSVLRDRQDRSWRLFLEPSDRFLARFPGPVDFVMHDGAHDFNHILEDLNAIMPKMRKFGLVCVHDTQEPDLYRDMLGALVEVSRRYPVSVVNLPFACGLALIRVEESVHPAVAPFAGLLPDGRSDTELVSCPFTPADAGSAGLETGSFRSWALGRKIEVGHWLRQRGLRR